MDDSEKANALRLMDQLKDAPRDCGLLFVQGKVVVRCPNLTYTDTVTTFSEADFKNAIELGLLEKHEYTAIMKWEHYLPKGS